MTIQDAHPNVQAFRRVYENGHSANSSSASEENICIVCHPDASSGRDIVLWDDILAVFKSALYVRSGAVALPFLKGLDFKNLDPLRIAAVPGASLDIVVRGQPNDTELSVESLQESLPDAPHENSGNVTSATAPNAPATARNSSPTTTVKRNLVGGYVETAWENYMYIDDTPPTAPNIIPSTAVRPVYENGQSASTDPLRIAAVPGVSLDVVVRGRPEEMELSLKSLQKALPGAHQQGDHNNAAPVFNASAVATAGRNSAGELVKVAWENYTHIDDHLV
ncbi:MAG: hypothetical protein J3R72DRAFT_477084 [Linnemannia gamsii]|nr:MAG: hypothetical protein J3R72DRAFT_477084 [Linnemannia gamsii]